ncbi:uncharacterized protein TNCV_2313081 [Trichonephila clavipes]|nr:uncharacterized protein TNCV_2313081 [Trichonephila clavipes]
MAALVSEYTLEYFTLLDARGKKELIEWCMKEGLIASSYECPKCNEQMGLNERKSVVLDGFEWRCRKKGVNTHVCRKFKALFGRIGERYTTTNRRAPLAIRPLEALVPGQDDGAPSETKVTSLPQQPSTELPLANAGKEQRPQDFSLKQHTTNSCYPIGQAVRSSKALRPLGRGSCK